MPKVSADEDDDSSADSVDNDLDFRDPNEPLPRSSGRYRVKQPKANTKIIYLQLSGDKYRCNVNAHATWEELKSAVENRLGVPSRIATVVSLRGNRDGALVRTGEDVDDGEYVNVILDIRAPKAKLQQPHSPERRRGPVSPFGQPKTGLDVARKFVEGNYGVHRDEWTGSTNPRTASRKGQQAEGKISDPKLVPRQQPAYWVVLPNKGPPPPSDPLAHPAPWIQAATGGVFLNKYGTKAPFIAGATTTQTQRTARPRSAPLGGRRAEAARELSPPWEAAATEAARGLYPGRPQSPASSKRVRAAKVTHRPKSAPARRPVKNRDATACVPLPGEPAPHRTRAGGLEDVPPLATGASQAMEVSLRNPMDTRQRQMYRQMGAYPAQRRQRAVAASKLADALAEPAPQLGVGAGKGRGKPDELAAVTAQLAEAQAKEAEAQEEGADFNAGEVGGGERKATKGGEQRTQTRPASASGRPKGFVPVGHPDDARAHGGTWRRHALGARRRLSTPQEEARERAERAALVARREAFGVAKREGAPPPGARPWMPTRNCDHRSALFSVEYPLMSHDGPGGPSMARTERFESKRESAAAKKVPPAHRL